MHKKVQASIINDLAERYPMIVVAQTVDKLKDAGFYWATRSGVTVSMADVMVPPNKQEILDRYEKEADGIEKKYQRGALNHDERNGELVKIWQQATEEVGEALRAHYPEDNPIITIVDSGATGNFTQTRTLAGMKGLVTNPKGEFIPRPIKSSFREGLTVLEYFINTHGARKGLADTALRTADSGYLTRRLVDVSQDVIVREPDCETERGINVTLAELAVRRRATSAIRTSKPRRTRGLWPPTPSTRRATSSSSVVTISVTRRSMRCSRRASPRSRFAPC